jgi:hypothetical protein
MLTAHKPALLALLAPGAVAVNETPVAPSRCPGWCCPPRPTAWEDPDAAELVAWFATFPPPREPFDVAPWRQVTDPELFCRTLAEDIARGPAGPHVHHAHVIADLRTLRHLFGPEEESRPPHSRTRDTVPRDE